MDSRLAQIDLNQSALLLLLLPVKRAETGWRHVWSELTLVLTQHVWRRSGGNKCIQTYHNTKTTGKENQDEGQ